MAQLSSPFFRGYLKPRERDILEWLASDEHENRLTLATPGGWWWGLRQTSGAVGWSLVRQALISTRDSLDSDYIEWYINEHGKAALNQRSAS